MTQVTDTDFQRQLLDRLDRIEADLKSIREIDLPAIKISQAKMEGLLEGFNKRFDSLETRITAQDTRLWGFIVALSLAVIGFLSRLAFFPQT